MPARQNKRSKDDPSRALYAAIGRRDLKAVQRLLAEVADVNALGASDGDSLLRYTMLFNGAEDIGIALIEAGLALGPRDLNLVWAASTLRPDVVRKFIDAGADPNARAPIGTPLGVIAGWPRSRRPAADETLAQMTQMLLDAGADVNVAGACGTPLGDAVLENNTGPALALIAAGADLGPPSPGGDPLLVEAIRHRNVQIARALIDAGVNVNERAVDGTKPVELARRLRQAEIVSLIEGRTAKAGVRRGSAATPRAKRRAKPAPAPAAKVTKLHGVPPAFGKAVADLERLCGTKAFPLEGTAGFTLHVDTRSGFDLDKAFKQFQKRGFLLIATDMHRTRVAILPTTDKYEAIAEMGTNGANFGLAPDDVIKWLRDLEKTQPFELTGIGFDFLFGRFTKPVAHPAELAKRMYEFCPGEESEGDLARQLKKSREFSFWWD